MYETESMTHICLDSINNNKPKLSLPEPIETFFLHSHQMSIILKFIYSKRARKLENPLGVLTNLKIFENQPTPYFCQIFLYQFEKTILKQDGILQRNIENAF